MGYSVMAWVSVRTSRRPARWTFDDSSPVTILKPLHGREPETYECLRSFCDQEYPEFQVVFGVSDIDDPALAVVKRLQREFPHRDLRVAIDGRQHGSNRKVSNLINMMPFARHDLLVLSDSDVRVKRDYLRNVVAPLLDARVGIVTCPYRGVARRSLWSLLGSMYINEWFMPSVRVAAMAGSRSFAFGATIAIRRQVLAGIGGFESIADQLADDYRLGELTRRIGLRTVLSEVEVETFVCATTLRELVRHELRWLRTIRVLRPSSYGFFFITFGVPITALDTLAVRGAPLAVCLLATTIAARMLLHLRARRSDARAAQFLVWPLRDILSFGLWGWSFATNRVEWREHHYRVAGDGSIRPLG